MIGTASVNSLSAYPCGRNKRAGSMEPMGRAGHQHRFVRQAGLKGMEEMYDLGEGRNSAKK